MRLGLLSDSHGKTDRLHRAIQLLKDRRIDTILHCGDLGDLQDLEALAWAGLSVYVVLGNTDRHMQELIEAAVSLKVNLNPEVIELPLDDGRLLAGTHGDDDGVLRQLIVDGRYAYVCHGHSHRRRDERIGPTRVINPGAITRANPPSLALLDTATDELEFIELRAT